MTKDRAVAVMIRDNKILMMKRFRKERGEYIVFVGGTMEEGEEPEDALFREVEEEIGIKVEIDRFLFKIHNRERDEFWYLIKQFDGEPKLGGPEKDIMTDDNQYIPIWMTKSEFESSEIIFPKEVISRIKDLF